MCSGCSGQFEDGEYWERGNTDPLDGDAEAAWSDTEEDTGESDWPQEPVPGEPHGARNDEGYEIFVSGERIVERRTIRANHIASREGVLGAPEPWHESPRERQQSQAATARTYRTQRYLGSNSLDRHWRVHMWLMRLCLAVAAAAMTTMWLVVR
jgi:hypothetical protein